MIKKFNNIINHYIKWETENPDTWIEHTCSQNDLTSAIAVAVLSVNHLSKTHNHQKRLQKINLESFKNKLLKRQKVIQNVADFDKLFKIMEESKVKGVGVVAFYDIANRLGNRLGKKPEFVYLHAGTRKGLENLLGYNVKSRYIKKSDLPEPFKSSSLTCHEIEDILCIYKDRLIKKAHNKS
jgi:hypothetical protein